MTDKWTSGGGGSNVKSNLLQLFDGITSTTSGKVAVPGAPSYQCVSRTNVMGGGSVGEHVAPGGGLLSGGGVPLGMSSSSGGGGGPVGETPTMLVSFWTSRKWSSTKWWPTKRWKWEYGSEWRKLWWS